MYRGYYKIIVIVQLVGQGGHTKVWYDPFGIGLGQRHGEMVCAPLYIKLIHYVCMYYMYTIST